VSGEIDEGKPDPRVAEVAQRDVDKPFLFGLLSLCKTACSSY